MSQDHEPNGVGSGDETDGPIAELASLEQEISPLFLTAVRKKIHRRTATSQAASFSWNVPKVIFFELLGLMGHFVSSSRTAPNRRKGGSF